MGRRLDDDSMIHSMRFERSSDTTTRWVEDVTVLVLLVLVVLVTVVGVGTVLPPEVDRFRWMVCGGCVGGILLLLLLLGYVDWNREQEL